MNELAEVDGGERQVDMHEPKLALLQRFHDVLAHETAELPDPPPLGARLVLGDRALSLEEEDDDRSAILRALAAERRVGLRQEARYLFAALGASRAA
jgi:hypothetical protein